VQERIVGRFRLFIPGNKVRLLLSALRPYLPNQHDLEIHPLPLKSIFKVSVDTRMDLELLPMIQLMQENGEDARTDELRRLIAPVTLRRRKESVLRDLPPKIEDIRTCTLSDEQVRLYGEAVNRRAPTLVSTHRNSREKVPYIHIFALLNLLKQICDHPALLSKAKGNPFEGCPSGKWDLFLELLAECLDSGQKVVVYSQFLGMIDIMKQYLVSQGVGHVSLTGKSRNRGEIVSSFNEDPDCRVYVGSLKAGGTGIDLVAASVVIH